MPVGVPPSAPVTVAVNITDCPEVAGLAEEDKDVVVLMVEVGIMFCAKEALLPTTLLSPL